MAHAVDSDLVSFLFDCPNWIDFTEESYKKREDDEAWFGEQHEHLRTPKSIINREEAASFSHETTDVESTPGLKKRKKRRTEVVYSSNSTTKSVHDVLNDPELDDLDELLRAHNERVNQAQTGKTNLVRSSQENSRQASSSKTQPRYSGRTTVVNTSSKTTANLKSKRISALPARTASSTGKVLKPLELHKRRSYLPAAALPAGNTARDSGKKADTRGKPVASESQRKSVVAAAAGGSRTQRAPIIKSKVKTSPATSNPFKIDKNIAKILESRTPGKPKNTLPRSSCRKRNESTGSNGKAPSQTSYTTVGDLVTSSRDPRLLKSGGPSAVNVASQPPDSDSDLDDYLREKLRVHNMRVLNSNRVPGKTNFCGKRPTLHLGSPTRPKIKKSLPKR